MQQEREELERRAREEDRTVSFLVRRAVGQYLELAHAQIDRKAALQRDA
jgi:predicted transcriptional regulator